MTRGDKVIFRVEEFCVVPFGVDRGQHVRLSVEQKEIVARFSIVTMHLKSRNRCRQTWHVFCVAGPRNLAVRVSAIPISADIFSTCNATGPDLHAVLKREGDDIVCPELGTHFCAQRPQTKVQRNLGC